MEVKESGFDSNYATNSAVFYIESNHTSISMEGLTVKNNVAEFGNSFGEYRVDNFDIPLFFDNGTLIEPTIDANHYMSVSGS